MAQMYKEGLQTFAPIVPHIMDAWRRKGHKNLHFTTYESMKKDLEFNVREVARFMGKSLTEKQMETLLKAVDIESFRKNRWCFSQFSCFWPHFLAYLLCLNLWKFNLNPDLTIFWRNISFNLPDMSTKKGNYRPEMVCNSLEKVKLETGKIILHQKWAQIGIDGLKRKPMEPDWSLGCLDIVENIFFWVYFWSP